MGVTKRRMRLRKAEAHPELSCPRPEKVPYMTDIEAISQALRRSKISGIPLRVYPRHTMDGKTHYHLTKKTDKMEHA